MSGFSGRLGFYPGEAFDSLLFTRVTYVGDGTASKLISVGFAAKFVFITRTTNASTSFFTWLFAFGSSVEMVWEENTELAVAPPAGQVFTNSTSVDVGSINATVGTGVNTLNVGYVMYAYG